MCPENAKIAIFEDNLSLRTILSRNLTALGHTIVAEARTMPEAQELIPRLKDLGTQIAVIDGTLGPVKSEGREGAEIARGIKESSPGITTIGWSTDFIEGTDLFFGKGDYKDVFRAITEL
jgi:hypothetical protein